MTQTVYIVTGANRGIGLAICQELAKSTSNLIFAGARKPDAATELNALAKQTGTIHVVKLCTDSAEDNRALAQVVRERAGRVDFVVANAGITSQGAPIASVHPDVVKELFSVNTLGALHLFQATHDLISKGGVFAVTSSGLGSIGKQYPGFPIVAYGTSKAAVNYLCARIRAEHPDILTAAIHPGLVATAMAAEMISRMDGPTQKAYGVLTPEQSGALFVQNLEKVRADKPETAVFLLPGGRPHDW